MFHGNGTYYFNDGSRLAHQPRDCSMIKELILTPITEAAWFLIPDQKVRRAKIISCCVSSKNKLQTLINVLHYRNVNVEKLFANNYKLFIWACQRFDFIWAQTISTKFSLNVAFCCRFVGSFRLGLKEGPGVLIQPSGERREGSWAGDRLRGRWDDYECRLYYTWKNLV